jgi:hypothetical protein
LTDISEVLAAYIIHLMMEAVGTCASAVNLCETTRHNIPEVLVHSHLLENLTYHVTSKVFYDHFY